MIEKNDDGEAEVEFDLEEQVTHAVTFRVPEWLVNEGQPKGVGFYAQVSHFPDGRDANLPLEQCGAQHYVAAAQGGQGFKGWRGARGVHQDKC